MRNKIILLVIVFSNSIYANFNFNKDLSLKKVDKDILSESITNHVFASDGWPKSVEIENRVYQIEYSLNEKLENYIQKELKRYGTSYTSIVVIDNNNGSIVTAIDYAGKSRTFNKNLTFSSTNPAASIFKVVTAAELIENTKVNENTQFSYNGRSSTLYKYQLKENKNKWTRDIPLSRAFASSNNVVFAKAAMQNTDWDGLTKMANRFGFNQPLMQMLDVGSSKLFSDNDTFGLAELASGFNRKTLMSPLHGAIIASIVANDGVLLKPSIISSVKDVSLDRLVWKPKYIAERIFSTKTASEMQDMMELTVKRGTARGAFRPWKIKALKNIRLGGKTGSITGGLPYGKRDWFVSYAKPEDSNDKGISICVMIVNEKKWYIKSTEIARNVMNYYYKEIKKSEI